MLHTCFPAGCLHPLATVRGVALCLSYPPPPPIDFFYRIAQLLCRFVLCRFHLSFGLVTFGDIEGDLNRLILRFGLPDSRENAHYPFWHLCNDGLWQIDRPQLVRRTTAGDAYVSDLREHDIRGGLAQDFLEVLDTNPDFAWRVVQSLLNDYFPPSLHEDVLEDVGLVGKVGPSGLTDPKSRHDGRDRTFRDVVLQAYKNRCAICALDVQVDGKPIGIEAAHIKWHSAKGPAQVGNGMALCVLHHK